MTVYPFCSSFINASKSGSVYTIQYDVYLSHNPRLALYGAQNQKITNCYQSSGEIGTCCPCLAVKS